MKFVGPIFLLEKREERKGRTRNFKKSSKIKRMISHFLIKNKRTKQESKWQKEKKQKMSSPIGWMKNNIFSDTSQQASKNAKTGETIFKTQKNKAKLEK